MSIWELKWAVLKIVLGAIFEKSPFSVPFPVFPGFEPVTLIFGGRRIIHWATEAKGFHYKKIWIKKNLESLA